jgi:rod shape-determining protein MreC
MIAKDVSTDFRTIRINRGKASGIEPNMAVINSEGVVGRVLRVNEDTSDVVTILDPLSAIDAYILRSRVRGIVEGLSDTLCQLKFALRVDDILPGDLLLSSGLGGNFPKGVPVGTVIKVTRKSFGITQKVEVKPSVDFSKVEEVMVVTHAEAAPAHVQLFEKTDAAPSATPGSGNQ